MAARGDLRTAEGDGVGTVVALQRGQSAGNAARSKMDDVTGAEDQKSNYQQYDETLDPG